MPGQTNKAAKAASKPTYGIGLTSKPFELALPSGTTCLAVRPGAQGLIKMGLLDSMDQLTAFVQTEHIDSHDPKKLAEAVKAMSVSKDQLEAGLDMVDRAISFIVRTPKVHLDEQAVDEETGKPLVYPDGKPVFVPRDAALIYADEVDLEDKLFIFNWALGGTADLKSFRTEHAQLMGDLSAG